MKRNVFLYACQSQNLELIQYLINHYQSKINIHAISDTGFNAIVIPCLFGDLILLQYLIELNIDYQHVSSVII